MRRAGRLWTDPGVLSRAAKVPIPAAGASAASHAGELAGAPPGGRRTKWTAGRIVAVLAGAVLVLCSLGLLGAGGTALWAHTAARQGGYVNLGSATYRTSGYAVACATPAS